MLCLGAIVLLLASDCRDWDNHIILVALEEPASGFPFHLNFCGIGSGYFDSYFSERKRNKKNLANF